jgi:peptidoglycan/xylan/chitin deacetylase (PgdA/CDA1 family)
VRSLKLIHASIITTGIVLFASAILVFPEFVPREPPVLIILSFDIANEQNLPTWCNELSQVLEEHGVNSVIFLRGKTAEKFPDCVTTFHNGVDIGSQTYSYVDLPSITDYSIQLEEVEHGKHAIDQVGNLDTKLFKAPYGSTDENIYSLLSKSGILADFSYEHQFNKFYKGKFIKFDTVSYHNPQIKSIISEIKTSKEPIILSYDNNTPVTEIKNILTILESENISFVSPSELTGINLTPRTGGMF